MNPAFLRLLALIACLGFLVHVPSEPIVLSAAQGAVSPADHVLADQLAASVSNTEWLGVLAPIAISPFFGIACLAGMSQFGGEWLGINSFVSTNPVLHNPAVFWIFLGLTILTSLPRLTKVSKPLAQAFDQIETYSAIIILLIIRFIATTDSSVAPEQVVMQMGIFSFTADVLLSLAAVINIVVINTVKFFFEVLVWFTPFPFVDALLEVANKTFCAGLLAIYVYSPLLATIINLVMFGICLWVFFWIHRRVTYIRTILFDPIAVLFSSRYGVPQKPELIVFPLTAFKSIPALAKVVMQPTKSGWNMTQLRRLRKAKTEEIRHPHRIELQRGMLINRLVVKGPEAGNFYFSRRFNGNFQELADLMQCQIDHDFDPETELKIV